MSNLYNTVSKDLLCDTTFENHKFVRKFMESNDSDPDYKQTIINAYMVRDVHYYGGKTLKDVVENHCSKLNLNPTTDQKKKKREYEFMKDIKNMVEKQEFVEDSIKDYYNKFISRGDNDREIKNKEKYESIMTLIDNGADMETVYNEFSIEDLGYLGW